jgi:hypothetical protein
MSSAQFAKVLPFARPFGQGHCKSCGCESADCRCGCRQCRKEAKELTFTADPKTQGRATNTAGLAASAMANDATGAAADGTPTTAKAFVGGGCCVHISLEYAPITATAQSTVAIIVKDTEGTGMLWEKVDPPGTHYQVKENVVTTKPGATIQLIAINATVRARWCEVFSC